MSTPTTPLASASALAPPPIPAAGGMPKTTGAAAPTGMPGGLLSRTARNLPWTELGVPVAVLGIVLAMIVPLPSFALDLLIALNVAVSVVVLLVGMSITKPVEFSVFPTTLLLLTLFRLALNISSSRLILLEGNVGTAAAGHVIEAFGSFVVGGNYIIGAVIFLVLIAIQYVVINHGAVRISEVTARFTLDALPGKQMSIDSDLNAGLIDESEARRRRKELAGEAEFYGAMDGASRFTQRDAVASILITGINIIAGFLIGVLQYDMDLRRALETYTVLTIGDGLVTVIPALMISITGGLIVTRASSDARLGIDVRRQILGDPQPLWMAAGVLTLMAMFPGLPSVPFLALAAASAGGASRLNRSRREAETAAPAAKAPPTERDNIEQMLRVEPLAIEVGLGLVRLVEGGPGSPLLRRIGGIRKQLAGELGFVLPPVRLADNLGLKAGEYAISLKGIEIARYEIPPGSELVINTGGAGAPPQGTPTREPAFGLEAWWIPSVSAEDARAAGFTVVDPVSVLGTHLSELARRHSHELFSRQDAKKLVDRVAEQNPKLVEEAIPKLIPLALLHRIAQNLLREQVSIRDGVSIVEALGEAAAITRNAVLLTEFVRQSLRRTIVRPYLDRQNQLSAFFLDPSVEQAIEAAIEHGEHASQLQLAPQQVREVVERIARATGAQDGGGVILAGSPVRYFLRQVLESSLRGVAVLSHAEIPDEVRVTSRGVVG
ncbi:MAG: flagellar biosynthesis protein FlhA [Bryobacteraceae bacterium]